MGPHRERAVDPPLLHAGEREIERQVGLHLEQVLPGAPEIEVGVEPAVAVVEDALDERRLEVAEPTVGQAGHAAEGRRGRGARHLQVELGLAGDAERVALNQAVEVVQIEPEHLHLEVPGAFPGTLPSAWRTLEPSSARSRSGLT